jgi:hypothetical protein
MELTLEFRKIRREGHGGILCYGHKGVPVAATMIVRPEGSVMPEVIVKARISEEHLRAYKAEARRQGVPVAVLVQQTVNCLIRSWRREQRECQEIVTS